eukprot:TRINITY_DN4030_c0_g1_i3.p1 TRINITY_DN4030_c0_g1~~TRINITY_DN4030_c0_g1_i3.p1  ORF type:complete len:243 (-),score=47.31 TRINITY_DN4030_c0_g1_i3:53-781(-)
MTLSDEYFGEGITEWNDKLIQLTWRNKKGFVYDKNFDLIQDFNFNIEGWGITHDGVHLIVSDGSDKLFFWNPNTFTTVKTISVKLNGSPLRFLNELEYVNGYVLANVWYQNFIVIISPTNGDVVGKIDLAGLAPIGPGVDVLNGIAYDAVHQRLFVTGKQWPKLYHIILQPPSTFLVTSSVPLSSPEPTKAPLRTSPSSPSVILGHPSSANRWDGIYIVCVLTAAVVVFSAILFFGHSKKKK